MKCGHSQQIINFSREHLGTDLIVLKTQRDKSSSSKLLFLFLFKMQIKGEFRHLVTISSSHRMFESTLVQISKYLFWFVISLSLCNPFIIFFGHFLRTEVVFFYYHFLSTFCRNHAKLTPAAWGRRSVWQGAWDARCTVFISKVSVMLERKHSLREFHSQPGSLGLWAYKVDRQVLCAES